MRNARRNARRDRLNGSPVFGTGRNSSSAALRVLLGVQRQGRLVPRQVMAVPVIGILFLQARRIGQQYLEQVGRPREQ